MNVEEVGKAIFTMRFGELLLKEPYLLQAGQKHLFSVLSHIQYEKLKPKLTKYEYKDLVVRIQQVLEGIKIHPTTPNNLVRWFYDQLIEAVNRFYVSIADKNLSANDIVGEILLRFDEARDTVEGNVNLYTTLIELLLDNNFIDTDRWDEIKTPLKEYDPELFGDILTKNEVRKLTLRVEKVLIRLKNLKID